MVPRRRIVILFCTGTIEWCGYRTVKKSEDMFSRFDRISACDGGTDGQTSCQTISYSYLTVSAVLRDIRCVNVDYHKTRDVIRFVGARL